MKKSLVILFAFIISIKADNNPSFYDLLSGGNNYDLGTANSSAGNDSLFTAAYNYLQSPQGQALVNNLLGGNTQPAAQQQPQQNSWLNLLAGQPQSTQQADKNQSWLNYLMPTQQQQQPVAQTQQQSGGWFDMAKKWAIKKVAENPQVLLNLIN